ncbi:spore germination protein [Paenibacillus gansuensis]|uniref:Spore germination protein n=1 Tax=Paenibacillus gansuensis TaxID=306542 RepID=A0ABW5PDU2_9BACL
MKRIFIREQPKAASKQDSHGETAPPFVPDIPQAEHITGSVQTDIEWMRTRLGAPGDLLVREFITGPGIACAVIGIDGLADKKVMNDSVLNYLLFTGSRQDGQPVSGDELLERWMERILPVASVKQAKAVHDLLLALLSGNTLIYAEGASSALIVDSPGWETRALEEPSTEALIRGPKIAFTENLRTNTAHLRRLVRDPNLRMETYVIGRRAQRNVVLAYIDGVVNQKLISEVNRRLKTIDIDDVQGSGMIEQWIADSYLSPFPVIINTERPDRVASILMEGKCAILVDGDPFALLMPVTFHMNIQSQEDYYQNWLVTTLVRALRLVGAFFATFLPAFYIALLEFQQGLIPSKLAFSISVNREGVPFPAVIEAFLMELTLELLREAGIRLPRPIGQTIGIVGGLVIGEAAVAAGIVSPVMVIVVAVTAIASFALPSYTFAISLRMVRFGVMLSAAFLGIYGIILSYILINIHLVHLKSFGVPYTTPFAPTLGRDWTDLVLRMPIMQMVKRLKTNGPKDIRKLKK